VAEVRPDADWLGESSDVEAARRLATFYDLQNDAKEDDLPFFREMARRTGGPILELACGSGRLTVPLAREGHRIVGLDSSNAMLDRARRRAEAAGIRLHLIQADVRDFALPEPFRLIFIAYNSFLLIGPEQRATCLARVREHLGRDGLFVIDVFQPDPEKIAGKQGAVVHLWTRRETETGHMIAMSNASVADVDGADVVDFYDDIGEEGAARRYARSYRLHHVYRRELELLLAANGFAIEAMYGSYDLESVGPRSPKLLTVARRRERGEGYDRRRG
jgi:ubiquinone/menaquinone biosynthesis C-methylase UbiE